MKSFAWGTWRTFTNTDLLQPFLAGAYRWSFLHYAPRKTAAFIPETSEPSCCHVQLLLMLCIHSFNKHSVILTGVARVNMTVSLSARMEIPVQRFHVSKQTLAVWGEVGTNGLGIRSRGHTSKHLTQTWAGVQAGLQEEALAEHG